MSNGRLDLRKTDCEKEIEASIGQISAYLDGKNNLVDQQKVRFMANVQNIRTCDINVMRDAVARTENTCSELKTLLSKEEQRRRLELQLQSAKEKGAYKRARQAWYKDDIPPPPPPPGFGNM